MSEIFLTSDLHFCHNKEFCYGPRGFSTVDEMNEALVENYNKIVRPDDIVYILGDCVLNDNEKGMKLLRSLNGHKYIALGNHDTRDRIEQYLHIAEAVEFGYRFRHKKIELWLSHYPMMMGNFDDPKPVWNLSGHTHSKDPFEHADNRVYNVCVDAHNNTPITLDEAVDAIKAYMRKQREERQARSIELNCNHCVEYPHYCSGGYACPPGLKYRRDPPDGGYYG